MHTHTLEARRHDEMTEFREEALRLEDRPRSYAAATAIVLLWLAALALVSWWVWRQAGT